MNDISQKIYDILKSELSDVTARTLLLTRCKAINKDIDNLTLEDIKNIEPRLLSSVLLFGGEEKAKTIKERLRKMH